jgi:hypothetical protein
MKMNNVYNYNQFLTEATLDDSKTSVDYQLSRNGRSKVMKFSTSPNIDSTTIKFEFSDETPGDDEEILWIKSSSFSKMKLSELKTKLSISTRDQLMVYKVVSDDFDFNWAVAKKGINSNMVRQMNRSGGSKRGDYFRETAFIIMLSIQTWKEKQIELDIHSNRGKILMDYSGEDATMSIDNPSDFNKMYEDFITDPTKKLVIENMEKHCKLLINYLGENISKVSYVIKNHKDMLINMMATSYLKDEISTRKGIEKEGGADLSEYGFYNMPEFTNIAKWNPSDIWIVFDEDTLDDSGFYDKNEIDSIDDLNDYLYKSMANRYGIVGVSLKQSKNTPRLYDINSDNRKIINKYNDFDVKGSSPTNTNGRKTAKIDFSFKGSKGWQKGSGIDIRTFDSSNKSSIQIEVKGTPGSGYVSGKAGSMINHLLPDDLREKKEIIRKGVDKEEIRKSLEKEGGITINNKKLKLIFNEDISGDGLLLNNENSRLQSIIFIDWLLSLSTNNRNSAISEIVKFAKSESVWSAPHLVLK